MSAAESVRLLIVEPDAQLGPVMRRWLASTYEVTLVGNGKAAIEEIRRMRPDAVLCELRLPDMTAAELHANIVPGLAHRVLFMTGGFVDDTSRQFLTGIGGQWIQKPFDLSRLRAALDALINA